ncbi:hypothetical protein ACSTG8_23435, partial [Vibrio parahaemolyticus]
STGAVGGAVNAVFAAVGGLIAVAMVTRRGGTRVIGAAVGGAAAGAAAAVASAACAVLMSGARCLDR